MAESLLSALLGQSAQERLANDPFYVSGIKLGQQQVAPRNNTEAFLLPALQGLASGGLQGLGRSNVASSMASSPLLEALKIDRSTLDTSDPFKIENALSQALLQKNLGMEQQKIDNEVVKAALGDINNPQTSLAILKAALGDKMKGIELPGIGGSPGVASPTESAFSRPEDEIYAQAVARARSAGVPATQVGAAANQAVDDWRKNREGTLESLEEMHVKANQAYDMGNRTREASRSAGATGSDPWTNIKQGANWIASAFSDTANEKLKAEDDLDALKPDVLKQAFVKGMGALNGVESQALFGSGPSSDRPNAFNEGFADRMELAGRLTNDYANLIQGAVDQGTPKYKVDQLWNQFKADNKLILPGNKVNTRMPSFEDWFAEKQKAQGKAETDLSGEAGILNAGQGDEKIQGYSISELKSAGYSDADIAALRGQ